jgi:stearoyl-CoA desaturase (delta-9 desaturase)
MSKAGQISNLLAVIIPFVAFILAVVLLWGNGVGAHDLVFFGAMYLITGFGVTIGFHRLLTHRSFQTSKPVEYLFAVMGSMSVQGPVISWVSDHRKHHAHSDEEGDPHSPHVGAGSGLRGLIHAHVGWLISEQGIARKRKYAADLMDDSGMRRLNRAFPWLVVLGLLLPAVAGWIWTGKFTGFLTGLLWGGLVRVFFIHHITWSINSVCHFFGRRRFDIEDHSTNVFWLALPTLGEAWHHNHHAFPRSAVHGLGRRELDPSAWVIRAMERLGLVWNVVRITPERQAQKLMVPATASAAVPDRVPTPTG